MVLNPFPAFFCLRSVHCVCHRYECWRRSCCGVSKPLFALAASHSYYHFLIIVFFFPSLFCWEGPCYVMLLEAYCAVSCWEVSSVLKVHASLGSDPLPLGVAGRGRDVHSLKGVWRGGSGGLKGQVSFYPARGGGCVFAEEAAQAVFVCMKCLGMGVALLVRAVTCISQCGLSWK